MDNNVAQYTGGILQFAGAGGTVTISNSTISGNIATVEDGAIFTSSPLALTNSTVAFNSAGYFCGGVRSYQPITMQSSIVANNSSPDAGCVDIYSTQPITGANNLVTVAAAALPPATIIADPRLTPLADHGGATLTHGLSLNSPAIDRGDAQGLATDQRGAGFARAVGKGADIGAFERQADDGEIFYGAFR